MNTISKCDGNIKKEMEDNEGIIAVVGGSPINEAEALGQRSDVEDVEESTVPPLEILQAEADKLREVKLVNEVFDQDLLLEIILDYAIHQNDGKNSLSRGSICATRLVHKEWLNTVAKLVSKDKEALFYLVLNKANSTNGTKYVRENGKLLDQFVDSITMTSGSGSVPIFSVKIMESFFREENLDSFSNFLDKCGAGLLKLEMFLPRNCGSFPGILSPRLSLPLLEKLIVHLTNTRLESKGERRFKDNAHVTYLLYAVLNSAQNLTEFVLPFIQNSDPVPSNFQRLLLPASLTKLTLSCPVTNQHLLLLNSPLPNLTDLELRIPAIESDGENLFKALDAVRNSLQVLSIWGINYQGPPRKISKLRLPTMEMLKELHLFSINCELDLPTMSSLEKHLPEISHFSLINQTEEMFRKWTGSSTYRTVRRVSVRLIDENDGGRVLSLGTGIMQRFRTAFPTVRNLDLEISSAQTCGLQYMFREMRQLVSLNIQLVGDLEPGQDSDFWDALFTGTTRKIISALRESPSYWEIVDFKNKKCMPSIKMLKHLTNLTLEAKYDPPSPNDDPDDDEMTPLNSDLLFHLALLKMPKLTYLCFRGRFVASDRVRQLCRNQNKSLF